MGRAEELDKSAASEFAVHVIVDLPVVIAQKSLGFVVMTESTSHLRSARSAQGFGCCSVNAALSRLARGNNHRRKSG
jgi:hypothetical protein